MEENNLHKARHKPGVIRSLDRSLLVIGSDSVGLFTQLIIQTVKLSEKFMSVLADRAAPSSSPHWCSVWDRDVSVRETYIRDLRVSV